MAGTNVTTDHDAIRHWVDEHRAQPALVRRIPEERGRGGELAIDMVNDGNDPDLVPVSWADFFQRFEDQHLAFEYDDKEGWLIERPEAE